MGGSRGEEEGEGEHKGMEWLNWESDREGAQGKEIT